MLASIAAVLPLLIISRSAPATAAPTVLRCDAGLNCSALLQSAIDAAALSNGTGRVSLAPGEWVVMPIMLRSNLVLEFAAGTTLLARRGAFHGGNDNLLSAGCFGFPTVTNLTIRGAVGGGSRLVMRKSDYMSASYTHSESRAGICIGAPSSHIRVSDVEISDTGGDGVYIGMGNSPARDVELLRVTVRNAYRNALSITNAGDVLVRDCRFLNTSGTPPEAGIDLEPNEPTNLIHNISIVNTEMRWNIGPGLAIPLYGLQCDERMRAKIPRSHTCPEGPPNCSCPLHPPIASVNVQGGIIQGAAGIKKKVNISGLARGLTYNIGLLIAAGSKGPPARGGSQGWLNFSDLVINETDQPGLQFEDMPVTFSNTARMPVTFSNCSWADVATGASVRWAKHGDNFPMLLHQTEPRSDWNQDIIGGIRFRNCTVRDSVQRPWLKCDSCGPPHAGGPVAAVTGTVTVDNKHGCAVDLGANASGIALKVRCDRQAAAVV